jgi:TolA-binding protein
MREDVIYRTKILEEKSKSLEEHNRIQEERTKTIDDRLKSLESKIDQLAKQADSDKSDLAREKESVEAKTSSTGAASLYKDAYEAFQKGDLDSARRKFEAFLKQYPNTELSDNAQFWMKPLPKIKAIWSTKRSSSNIPKERFSASMRLTFLELGTRRMQKLSNV